MRDTIAVVAPDKKIANYPFLAFLTKRVWKNTAPTTRYSFGLELRDVTDILKGKSEFNVFNNAALIKAIVIPKGGEFSKSQIEKLENYAKEKGAKGLAYTKVVDNALEIGVSKFFSPEIQQQLIKSLQAKPSDLILFVADSKSVVNKSLGSVRLLLGDMLGLRDPNILSFNWITGFPFYEVNDEGKLDFGHNPFSMPQGGASALDNQDPLEIESYQYDLTPTVLSWLPVLSAITNPKLS
jgi:aspartyl-tRNA synthetase